MLNSLNELVRQVRINVGDKRTTLKGVVILVIGLIILLLPTLPYAFELGAEQYAHLLEYAKIVGIVLCVLGLMLIGAIRSDTK